MIGKQTDVSYGSTANKDINEANYDLVSRSVDAGVANSKRELQRQRRRRQQPRPQYKHYYYGVNEKREDTQDDYAQTSAEILLSNRHVRTLCNSTYVVEPVAFIQNLATSIMSI